MKRRQFLGAVGTGAAVALSGCSGRYPTKVLHGLLPLHSDFKTITTTIVDTGVAQGNVYINEMLGAVQVLSSTAKLEAVIDSIPLQHYEMYDRIDNIPGTQSSDKVEPISTLGSLEMLSQKATGDNTRVGMIDTSAKWDKWYTGQVNHTVASQNMNPILGRLLGDKDHGSLTAKTLFHQDTTVSESQQTVRGLIANADAYHAEISSVITHPQFFRDLSDSLQWMEENSVEIISMPLLTAGRYNIIAKLIERFVEEVSASLVVTAAGNVDLCEGDVNSLADIDSNNVIGVGSIDLQTDSIQGNNEVIDILAPAGYTIEDSLDYTGTSSASTLISGVLSLYLSKMKKVYPDMSQEQYRNNIRNSLFSGSNTYTTTQCGKTMEFNHVNPMGGLQELIDMLD